MASVSINDFYAWTQQQAAAIRGLRWSEVDVPTLAEEIEEMGKEQKAALESPLRVRLVHLLKWQYQPAHRTPSWRYSLINSVVEMDKRVKRNPSLKPYLTGVIEEVYGEAVDFVRIEAGLVGLPSVCPYALEQIVDISFFPKSTSESF